MSYHLRPKERIALKAMRARRNGVKALILEGAPGTGKTALGKAEYNEDTYFDNPWSFSRPWSRRAKAKSTYVVGCGTAEEFISGIKLSLKERQ